MRERILSSVLLPAPLRPMMPTTSPRLISKDTSRNAQNSSLGEAASGRRFHGARSVSASVSRRALYCRPSCRAPRTYRFPRFSTWIMASVIGEAFRSEAETYRQGCPDANVFAGPRRPATRRYQGREPNRACPARRRQPRAGAGVRPFPVSPPASANRRCPWTGNIAGRSPRSRADVWRARRRWRRRACRRGGQAGRFSMPPCSSCSMPRVSRKSQSMGDCAPMSHIWRRFAAICSPCGRPSAAWSHAWRSARGFAFDEHGPQLALGGEGLDGDLVGGLFGFLQKRENLFGGGGGQTLENLRGVHGSGECRGSNAACRAKGVLAGGDNRRSSAGRAGSPSQS